MDGLSRAYAALIGSDAHKKTAFGPFFCAGSVAADEERRLRSAAKRSQNGMCGCVRFYDRFALDRSLRSSPAATDPTKKTARRPFLESITVNQRNVGPWKPIHIANCSATLAPSFLEKRSNADSCTVKSTSSFSPITSRATELALPKPSIKPNGKAC